MNPKLSTRFNHESLNFLDTLTNRSASVILARLFNAHGAGNPQGWIITGNHHIAYIYTTTLMEIVNVILFASGLFPPRDDLPQTICGNLLPQVCHLAVPD